MQIQAGVPVQMIDVLQGVILFFLAADIIVRQVFRIRARRGGVAGARRRSPARTAARARGPRWTCLFDIPLLGPVLQLLDYLVRVVTLNGAVDPGAGHPARPRSAVRVHERALRRRQHRHRGHDAGGAFCGWFVGVHRWSRRCPPSTPGASSARRRRSSSASWPRSARACSSRRCMRGCASPSGPTRSSAARSSTSSRSGVTGYLNLLLSSQAHAHGGQVRRVRPPDGARRPAGRRLDHQDVPAAGPHHDVGHRARHRPADPALPVALGPPDPRRRRASQGRRDRGHRRHRDALSERHPGRPFAGLAGAWFTLESGAPSRRA